MSAPPAPALNTGRRVVINTSALAAGNVWRIGAAFLVQVLVARRLGVEALGAFSVALAYLNVGQIVIEAGLPALLVREVSGQPARRRAWFQRALTLQSVMALAVWALLAGSAALLAPAGAQRTLLLIGGASLPLYALLSAAASIFEASERMELILAAEALANAVLLGGTLWVLWAGSGVAALLGVQVLAQATSALTALALLVRQRLLAPPQTALALPARATLRRAAPFFGIALTDILQQRSDLIVLSLIAGPALIGAYAAANSIVRVGIKLVAAFWRALYPTLVRLHDSAPAAFARLDQLALRAAAALTLPAAAVGMVVSGGVAAALFGPKAADAALPLALLAWTAPLYAFEQRAVTLLVVARRPRPAFVVALAQLLALLAALPPLTWAGGAPGAAAAGVVSGMAGALVGGAALARAALPLRLGLVARAGAAALIGALAAWLLPLPWLLRAAGGAAAFAVAAPLLGALGWADVQLLRSALRAPP